MQYSLLIVFVGTCSCSWQNLGAHLIKKVRNLEINKFQRHLHCINGIRQFSLSPNVSVIKSERKSELISSRETQHKVLRYT